MNHLEKANAALALSEASGLTKEAWDRNAWYSYIPVVGDIGNAVSNASDGNWGSAVGNLGMAALNFIPGVGLAAKGLATAGRLATNVAGRGIAKSVMGKAAPKLMTAAGRTQGVARRVANKTPGLLGGGRAAAGKGNLFMGSGLRNPGRWLAMNQGLRYLSQEHAGDPLNYGTQEQGGWGGGNNQTDRSFIAGNRGQTQLQKSTIR